MSEPYTWGSAPKLSFTVSDNISRSSPSSTNYSGTLTVTFGACSGGSKFGYTIGVTINGVYKKLKGNLPDQWSSLSASFSVSGDTTASSITIVGTLNTNAPRGDATFTYTTSIGSYSGGSSSGGGTTAGASVPTLSKSSAKLGEGLTIYTNRQSSSYTHTVAYTLGGTTATIATTRTTQRTEMRIRLSFGLICFCLGWLADASTRRVCLSSRILSAFPTLITSE